MNSPVKAKPQLAYYKTNVGIFIRNMWGSAYNNYQGNAHFDTYKFNGVVPNNQLVAGGSFLPLLGVQSIDKVERKVHPTRFVKGYALKEDIAEPLKSALKPFYTADEVGMYYDDDNEKNTYSNKEFLAVCAMYVAEYDLTEESWIEEDVEHVILGTLTVENYQEPEKMIVRMKDNGNFSSGKIFDADLSNIVCYSDIERILTPEFMLHTRPCELTSAQVYKIIRAYVKENINPRAAEITSDYDFCFTVKRKVAVKPIVKRTEVKKQNGRSYAEPRFKTNTTTYKSVELFEMTDSVHKRGYTVIQGWKANSLQDMQKQVKHYLSTLMSEINSEYQECECCKGVGAVVNKVGTNER